MEPNPVMYKKLAAKRKRDICINAGVAFDDKTEADFFVFSENMHGLNTFSKAQAEFWEQTGTKDIGKHKVEKVIKMHLMNINELIGKYFSPAPNLVSIDVEGLDLQLIKTIDFNKYKPELFCVETVGYEKDNKEIKNMELISYLESKGYFVYADTYTNTIFCRKDVYRNKNWD